MKTSQLQPVTPIHKGIKRKIDQKIDWMTASEVADHLKMSRSNVFRLTKREEDPIPCRKIAGKIQYNPEMLVEWEERNSITNY